MRRGSTATEVLVAATLLLGMIGLVVPTAVRTGKIWRDTRQFQIATNELANQFETLSQLPLADLQAAIPSLKVAEHVASSLPNPELTAVVQQDTDGNHLTLSLTWDRGPHAQPLQLTGWLPEPQSIDDEKDASDETK